MATQPNATNSPHLISSNVLAYTDANGVAQQITLKPLPAPGSTFGTDVNGNPNNGARVNSNGSVTIIKDGTVIDGYILSNGVLVEANNVTVQRSSITGGLYNVQIGNVTGTLIQDSELSNASNGIIGHDFTAQRVNIHNELEDGIVATGSNGTVLDSYIHNLGTEPGAHADGISIYYGSNWTIRGNNIDMPEGVPGFLSNSCIDIETYTKISNIIIDGNWFNGGNYTIYSIDKGLGYGPPTGVQITNNFLGHGYNYGVLDADPPASVSIWQNNRWVDTNLLLNFDGSTGGGGMSRHRQRTRRHRC